MLRGTTWTETAIGNFGSGAVVFPESVACTAATSCLMLASVDDEFAVGFPRWDGSSWTTVAGPDANTGPGLSCASASFCVAPANGDPNSLDCCASYFEVWNGTGWSRATAPQPIAARSLTFNDVSCASSTFCMAVADGYAERWNGLSWSRTRGLTGGRLLHAVSCRSATRCTAAGTYSTGKSLIEQLNGSRWWRVASPSPGSGDDLTSISCTSTSFCMAVGQRLYRPLAERWNGRSWQVTSNVPLPRKVGRLISVSCVSATRCVAVGSVGNGPTVSRWNGSSWSTQRAPALPADQIPTLNAVSCPSRNFCLAVGYVYLTTNSSSYPLAERWNGHSWRTQNSATLRAMHDARFEAVSCAAPSVCVAVGSGGSLTASAALWHNSRWTATPTAGLGVQYTDLDGVSCVDRTCTAVGTRSPYRSIGTLLAERRSIPSAS